jgi:hypothetical protein
MLLGLLQVIVGIDTILYDIYFRDVIRVLFNDVTPIHELFNTLAIVAKDRYVQHTLTLKSLYLGQT